MYIIVIFMSSRNKKCAFILFSHKPSRRYTLVKKQLPLPNGLTYLADIDIAVSVGNFSGTCGRQIV
jgi:hypothetical protein